jgi:hypothetical protein
MSDTNSDRRRFLAQLAALTATGLFGRGVLAQAAAQAEIAIDEATIEAASSLAGLSLSPEERALMRQGVAEHLSNLRAVRALALRNEVPPALRFRPDEGLGQIVVGPKQPRAAQAVDWGQTEDADPAAFASLRTLRTMLDKKQISAVELTRRTLARLREVDVQLHCVIELTEARALEEAARADSELAAGKPRGPLHGIP